MPSKSYSRKKCKNKSISRKSYSYVRKSTGKQVKVKATCVKSRALRSRGIKPKIVVPALKKGKLSKYGYAANSENDARHKALRKALKEYGYAGVIKKLNAVKILSRNTNPRVSSIYASDIEYLQKNHSA